jgi:carbon storage regulator
MLVLSRKIGEEIVIGDDVVVKITRIKGNRVTIAIEAPGHVRIIRGEIADSDDGTHSREEVPAA